MCELVQEPSTLLAGGSDDQGSLAASGLEELRRLVFRGIRGLTLLLELAQYPRARLVGRRDDRVGIALGLEEKVLRSASPWRGPGDAPPTCPKPLGHSHSRPGLADGWAAKSTT
jgi:hypothetical protein